MITRRKLLQSLGLSALGLTLSPSLQAHQFPVMPASNDSEFWLKIRKQFMLAEDKVFFNTGTVGAMPKIVVQKMTEHLNMMATDVADWAYKNDNEEQFIAGYNNLLPIRTKVAELLNCSVNEISITDNVTHGMSYLANGITLQAGDEVLTTDQEHPGGRGGWLVKEKRQGVIFKSVKLGKPIQSKEEVLEAIVKSFNDKTKVLMVSHIISGSGAILPVKELCEAAAK